jgi:non-heme chloroperoxidase
MPYLVSHDQVPLYYEDHGPRKDSAIFLIHGEPFNTKFWVKNIPGMAKQYRTVSIDVRGRGESGKTDDGQTLGQMARDFRFFLEGLKLQKVVAVGWSMGSAIIWDYIKQFGEDRIAGFVDVDQRPYRFTGFENLQARLDVIRSGRLAYHVKGVKEYFGPETMGDEETVNWMAYECMKTPTTIHRAAAIESFLNDYRPVLPTMKAPSLIMWAKYGGVDKECADLLHNGIKKSRLVFFEKSGHLLPWTEAEKFNREIMGLAKEVLG